MVSEPLILGALLAHLLSSICAPMIGAASAGYQAGFANWRAADGGFAGWQLAGVARTADGALQLDRSSAEAGSDPAGAYNGGNFYNGGSYLVGEAVGPVQAAGFEWSQAIASWNAQTPPGSWIETQIQAQIGTRWTRWYNLGVWAADQATVARHSVGGQADADGNVVVDTLVMSGKPALPTAFRLKLRLFSANGGVATPVVRGAAVAFSTTPARPKSLAPGNPRLWNTTLPLPECSQMVYRDGGEVWCSPTSVAMVLGYWQRAAGPCEPRVRAAVEGVYDRIYRGHGNWPFNTAYAATHGLEGYVARFTSLAQAESWIAAGVPVVMSYSWKKGELTGAPIKSSAGHLVVLAGFDAAGNPVINDPAAPGDATVQRTYHRAELEKLWLEHSGGTVYLVYPPGTKVPAL